MKIIKAILIMTGFVIVATAGCGQPYVKVEQLQPGMTFQEVQQLFAERKFFSGPPELVAQNTEMQQYRCKVDAGWTGRFDPMTPYLLTFKDGKLIDVSPDNFTISMEAANTRSNYHRQNTYDEQEQFNDPFLRIEKVDAYGPGIHMDQYGRPVTITPRE